MPIEVDYSNICARYIRKFEVYMGMDFDYWIDQNYLVSMGDYVIDMTTIIHIIDNQIAPDLFFELYEESMVSFEKHRKAHCFSAWLRMRRAGKVVPFYLNDN